MKNLKGYETHGYIYEAPHVKVSGISTTSSKIEGAYRAGITTTTFALVGVGSTSSGVGADSVTGIVTHFRLAGDISKLRENDVLGIGTERVRVPATPGTDSTIRFYCTNTSDVIA